MLKLIKKGCKALLLAMVVMVGACTAPTTNEPASSPSSTADPISDPVQHAPPPSDRFFYLPAVIIDTAATPIPDDPKILSSLKIFPAGHLTPLLTEQAPLFDGFAGIELRGSSSLNHPKKQYGLETWDEEEEALDVPLLGLPAEADWILNGTYSDKSLMRNVLAYELSRQMGHYASRYRWVEMVVHENAQPLNLQTHYMGVYALLEKIKRGSSRVNIAKLNPSHDSMPNISGGYILKLDRLDAGEYQFLTGQGTPYVLVYPKASQITDPQKAWIQEYIEDVEDRIAAMDPDQPYTDLIDVDTFVDFFLLNEVFKNVDAYRLSTFLHKDRLGKTRMGPVWDFDIAAGNCDYYDAWNPQGWMLGSVPVSDLIQPPFWWTALKNDPAFWAQVQARWQVLRGGVFAEANFDSLIDGLAAEMGLAISENFLRWPILGVYIPPNYFVGEDYPAEIQYLKDWLQQRLIWMDSEITP